MGEDTDYPYRELTRQIISAAFEVSNTLGCGFLEKVHENALVVELRERGLRVTQQVPLRVIYKQETVGEYVADVIVDSAVLVETKATNKDDPIHLAQTLNYLRATRLPVGLILNFGKPRVSWRRVVLSQEMERERQELDRMTEYPPGPAPPDARRPPQGGG